MIENGRVAERFNVPDSKSGVGVTLPWVQIPPRPFSWRTNPDIGCACKKKVPCLVVRMRNLLLSTLILASALQAALGEQDGDWAYSVSNGQATITRYTGAGGALTIPIVVNGIPVVKVGDGQGQWTFSGSVEITSLIIPSSVTALGIGRSLVALV